MMAACKHKVLVLNDFEYRVMLSALADKRTEIMEARKPPDDVNDLILKAIDAPVVRGRKAKKLARGGR